MVIKARNNHLRFRNTVLAIFLISCSSIIGSCKKKINYNLPTENKIVVLAEITAGDTAYIPLTRSIVAGSGNIIQFEKLNDATVTITGQNGTQYQLYYNSTPSFNDVPAAVYSHPDTFHSNTNYTLQVSHPDYGQVTAFAHIPSPVTIMNVETEENTFHGKNVLDFDFSLKDNSNEENFYIFEAVKQLVHVAHYFYWQGVQYDYDTQTGFDLYNELDDQGYDIPVLKDTIPTGKYLRLHVYTSDIRTDNSFIGTLDSSFRRIFLKDSLFNGQDYSTRYSIVRDHFASGSPEEKGIVLIRIRSVDESIYRYLLESEKYKTQFGRFPVLQLNSPEGNIQGGFGVFGGSVKQEWKFYYDVLE